MPVAKNAENKFTVEISYKLCTHIYAIKIRWTDFLKCTQLVCIKQEVQYMFIDVIKLYMIMDNESIGY